MRMRVRRSESCDLFKFFPIYINKILSYLRRASVILESVLPDIRKWQVNNQYPAIRFSEITKSCFSTNIKYIMLDPLRKTRCARHPRKIMFIGDD